MRIIGLNLDDENTLARVADNNGIDRDKLWNLYRDITKRNFFDDLCDIVRENEGELKGD